MKRDDAICVKWGERGVLCGEGPLRGGDVLSGEGGDAMCGEGR